MKRPTKPRTPTKRDPWLCGYACALANVWRNFHDQSAVRITLQQDGMTIAQLVRGGAAAYDVKALREACK